MCNHRKPKAGRRGSALEHGRAHQRDHAYWSRRNFLYTLGMAGTATMTLGSLRLTAMSSSPLAFALNEGREDRILVLIRLKGGNDGLNMIVPIYDYSTYRASRPTIAIPERDLIGLNDTFGMPNTMQPLQPIWEEGQMKVVHAVGYPEPNLSHFGSSDIWASARDTAESATSGWLGRWLNGQYPDFLTNPPDLPPAIQIGGSGNLVFQNEDMLNLGVVVNNPEELAEIAENGELYNATDVPECQYGEQLSFLRTVANSTFKYAEIIAGAYEQSANALEYSYSLGRQLALVARLIKGGLGTRLYMVTLDGFDTHANQADIHPNLMRDLSTSVQEFFQDLSDGGWDEQVLCMSHSEFGRRVDQNGSGGTDHGTAAPLILFGSGLNGSGFVGQSSSLQDLDAVGNLRYTTDFRQVYATLLESWLCINAMTVDQVLGANYGRLQLGLQCQTTATSNPAGPMLEHYVANQPGAPTIHYSLPRAARVYIGIYNTMGQQVAVLFEGRQYRGDHQQTVAARLPQLPPGQYVYSIRTMGGVFSGKLLLTR